MTDKELIVPIETAAGAFFARGTSFIVTGPTNDLSIQLAVCEDVIKHDTMTLTVKQEGGIKAEFSGSPRRLLLGSIKLSLQSAKELAQLLQEHIQKTQEAVDSLQKGNP